MKTPCCSSSSRCCRIAGRVLLGAVLGLGLAGAFGAAVRLLWNHVMPGLFPVPRISFCQAFTLLLLARLLFGRFGGHGHHRWFHGCRDHEAPREGFRFWKRCGCAKDTPEA